MGSPYPAGILPASPPAATETLPPTVDPDTKADKEEFSNEAELNNPENDAGTNTEGE